MWKNPHLQKKSVKNPASSKVICEPLGLPGGDLVYHIFEPHITWKLNFFPKLKKFPNASIRANMRFVKTRFVRRILAISRVLEFFPRIWWGSNSHRLLPYHSRRPLHYHTWWSSVVFTYYVLLLFFLSKSFNQIFAYVSKYSGLFNHGNHKKSKSKSSNSPKYRIYKKASFLGKFVAFPSQENLGQMWLGFEPWPLL